jgi:membrane-bound lytic murein transglycosylase MltF
MMRRFFFVMLTLGLTACQTPAPTSSPGSEAVEEIETAGQPPDNPTPEEAAPSDSALLAHAIQPWTGDLDGILERGFLRVATVNNPLIFGRDGLLERGLAVDMARELEVFLNKHYAKKGQRADVVLMPMARDALLPAVLEGRADYAYGNLTITPKRSEQVAFTEPMWKGVRELVVSGPAAPAISSIDDLAATRVYLRRSSSYFEHLSAINEERKAAGEPVVPIETIDEYLEDYDLLEMVNVGTLEAIIVDSHKAEIWDQVFDNITVHDDLVIHAGGEIAWAVRPDNPKLLAALNRFVATVHKGTKLGNILLKRYIYSERWIENVRSNEALNRYEATIGFIKRYAGEYEFDWLMIVAQAYQESGLDQSKRSKAGAIGVMQVLPTTAADPAVGIPGIEDAENNVHAGVKYLRFLRATYFEDPEISPLDRVLFSFAAYNAGPGAIRRARTRAEEMGLDPNRWFDNVELAAARVISREPVVYVRNIYKYYVSYKLLEKSRAAR